MHSGGLSPTESGSPRRRSECGTLRFCTLSGRLRRRWNEAPHTNLRSPTACLVNQLERKLDLAGRSGGLANDPESGPAQDVVGQAEIDEIENVEEFRPEF